MIPLELTSHNVLASSLYSVNGQGITYHILYKSGWQVFCCKF